MDELEEPGKRKIDTDTRCSVEHTTSRLQKNLHLGRFDRTGFSQSSSPLSSSTLVSRILQLSFLYTCIFILFLINTNTLSRHPFFCNECNEVSIEVKTRDEFLCVWNISRFVLGGVCASRGYTSLDQTTRTGHRAQVRQQATPLHPLAHLFFHTFLVWLSTHASVIVYNSPVVGSRGRPRPRANNFASPGGVGVFFSNPTPGGNSRDGAWKI